MPTLQTDVHQRALLDAVDLGQALVAADEVYAVHRGKGFFESLTTFMSSGRALVMVLEREGAIARLREVMGATNPANAAPGTIRKLYAADIEHNAVHGSDAPETAAYEIGYFFPGIELI